MKKLVIVLAVLFLITCGCGAIFKLRYKSIIKSPNSESTDKAIIKISQGDSLETISQSLVDNGILKSSNKTYFELYIKLNKLGPKIQAGTYRIPKNLSITEIAETIQMSQDQGIWITIVEGLRKDEIIDTIYNEYYSYGIRDLSEEKMLTLTTDQDFILTLDLDEEVKDLEGFLFPDRYMFPQDTTEESILKLMVDNFVKRTNNEYTYKDIIIASLVEREGVNELDRGMIADIINRRLEEGWFLNIDAAFLYYKKDWKGTITVEDKLSDNPYNTYKKLGLPPTPICNPGLESIQAAQNPIKNTYYYYLHDTDGVAHYATTLAEHEANIDKYLK